MLKRTFFRRITVISVLSFALITCVSCNKKINKDTVADLQEHSSRAGSLGIVEYSRNARFQREEAFRNYLQGFSLEAKIAQLFIESLGGNSDYFPEENFSDGTPLVPGGYLFFAFNIGNSAEDVISFTRSINDFCVQNNCVSPFLAIDHEGGSVNRLTKINAPLYSCEELVKRQIFVSEAYEVYSLQAIQLCSLGFHINLAPVVEICTEDNKDFLSGRSFGDEQQVLTYGTACISAYEKNGISTVVKHFPGNTNTDPHLGLPVIRLSKQELDNNLKSFKNIIQSQPAAVLMSHAIVDAVDKGVPSCLSKVWVTDILRNEYGFKGIIFSDDIYMAALAKNGYDTKTAVIKAVEAGIDCIMISGRRIRPAIRVMENKALEDASFMARIQESFERIINFKLQNGLLEYKANKDGTYKIVSVSNSLSATEQYIDFEKAKRYNIIYNEEINYSKK